MQNQTVGGSLQQEIDAAWALDTNALYGMLGEETRDLARAIVTIHKRSSMKSNNFQAAPVAQDVVSGEERFRRLWQAVKEQVCKFHAQSTGSEEGKDLVSLIVAALVAAGNVASPLLIVAITLAVKLGLDKLCEA